MLNQIIKLNTIDSTQNLAKQLAREGAASGTLILTETQSAGRGQYEHTWSSAKGGLYFSLVLRPEKELLFSPSLSLKVAQTVADTLNAEFGVSAKMKYPNDVLVYNSRRKKWLKVCGILIESSSYENCAEWLVIGVGVNLNNKIPSALKDVALSIGPLLGKKLNPDSFFNALIKNFSLRYREWLNSSEL